MKKKRKDKLRSKILKKIESNNFREYAIQNLICPDCGEKLFCDFDSDSCDDLATDLNCRKCNKEFVKWLV